MTCDWCITNSGRTHAARACCQIRMLAQAPRHAQAAFGKTLSSAERDDWRVRLVAEQKRLKGLK